MITRQRDLGNYIACYHRSGRLKPGTPLEDMKHKLCIAFFDVQLVANLFSGSSTCNELFVVAMIMPMIFAVYVLVNKQRYNRY